MRFGGSIAALTLALAAASCGPRGQPERMGYGPEPHMPAGGKPLIPTMNPATAIANGWAAAAAPAAPPGFVVRRFAASLDHPRWLYVLPNGDVLVAETNKPESAVRGVQDVIMRGLEKRAGALTPSADRITLVRNPTGDRPTVQSVFLRGLRSPFGMALVGGYLYVANTDSIVRVPYVDGETSISAKPETVVDLPANAPNNHWTRNLAASPDGRTLYVTVGSDSEAGEKGMAAEYHRADVLAVNIDGSNLRVYASGLRNPGALAFEPATQVLWTTVNERDMLGNDTPPDFMTGLAPGGFYGWPWSFFGRHLDSAVKPQRPDMVAKALTPDYALGAHTAPLGMAFYGGSAFPATYRGGAFIALHGSWNRTPRSGYKVIFVPFAKGRPAGPPRDFLTGFLDEHGDARGRPVDVVVAKDGALLVTDDVGDIVWRVSAR